MIIYINKNSKTYKVFAILSIFVIFFCVHFPADKIKLIFISVINNFSPSLVDYISSNYIKILALIIGPFKAFLFFVSLFILFVPLLKEFLIDLKNYEKGLLTFLKRASLILIAVSLLVLPLFLKSMGRSYGNISADAFLIDSSVYSKRILMPVIAYFLQLKGPILYFLFTIILIFLFTFLLIYWLDKNKINLNTISIISILSSSFYIFQFQYPGYPDILLFIFFILIMLIKQNFLKLILFALSLATHEASLFVLIPYFFFFEDKKIFKKISIISLLYVVLWLISFRFNLSKGLSSQNLGDGWVYEYIVKNSIPYLKGLFFSYKLLWLLILVYPILFIKNRIKELLGVGLIFLGAIIITLLAVDTSRLMGFSFMGFLIILKSLNNKNLFISHYLQYLLIFNLLIPSFYYGVNTGLVSFSGLYEWIYRLF